MGRSARVPTTMARPRSLLLLMAVGPIARGAAFQPRCTVVRPGLRLPPGKPSVRSYQPSLAHAASMASRSLGDTDGDDDGPVPPPAATPPPPPDLPESVYLPPQTKELFIQLTENYIYGTPQRPVTLERVLRVIEAEHAPLDVPIALGPLTIDVKQTGDEIDESVAEIFSLAAMYALSKEVTLYLLDSCILGTEQGDTKSELQLCREIFADRGWEAVAFPKGLALQIKKKYQLPGSESALLAPFALLQRQRRRVQQAQQAVRLAAQTRPPKQRLESRQDFFRTMEQELLENKGAMQSSLMMGAKRNLFFPRQTTTDGLRRVVRKLTRTADKQYARLKSAGRAGIVSYCFLNLLFYSIGVVWQWQRFGTPVNPLQAPSVTAVMVKKFAKVFGSLYVASQFFKLPKVVVAVALTPFAQKFVTSTKKQLRVSETVATVLLVGMQYMLWVGLVAVPILSEYTKLRRMVELERIVDIRHVAPAFYTAIVPTLLQDC